MKLSRENIEKINSLILARLREKKLIVFKADEEKVFEKMNAVFVENMRAEDELDREVEELLRSHTGEIDRERIDYRRMFSMIKGKLARERGLVI